MGTNRFLCRDQVVQYFFFVSNCFVSNVRVLPSFIQLFFFGFRNLFVSDTATVSVV